MELKVKELDTSAVSNQLVGGELNMPAIMSDTKINLINCAIKLFKQYGYDNVTISQICKAYEISKTSFYYHFKSKEDLISNYVLLVHQISSQSLAQIMTYDTYVEQLWQLFFVYIKVYEETGPEIMAQSYINKLKYQSNYLPGDSSNHEIFVTLITKAQSEKQILNSSDPFSLANTSIFLIRGIYMLWAMHRGGFTLSETCKNALSDLLQPTPGFELE